MNIIEIKQLLETEIPVILQESPGFKEWLQDFIRRQTVSKESFDERFDRMMNEFAADRENQRRHWDEQEIKIVISPMVDAKARVVAKAMEIEVFSYSDDVTGLAGY